MKSDLDFNSKSSTILHIDLNSCFATIEQQANPHLRGKPIAVAAYATPNGCILAPSIEAKKFGIKTGMRVKDGKLLYPGLIVLSPDPWKYRNVHLALRQLISEYTNDFYPKSIDEFVLDLTGYLHLPLKIRSYKLVAQSLPPIHGVAQEIKARIKKEIGEWLTVSIGIAPNRFLAKLASGLHKPDGLDEINKENFMKVYSQLKLTDLPYIKLRNGVRLNNMGIYTVNDFYNASIQRLKAAFNSIVGHYWCLWLRGWETCPQSLRSSAGRRVDDVIFGRRSYGNSYALLKPLVTSEELSPILAKLVTKMGARLRHAGYKARGVHVAISYRDGGFWHKGVTLDKVIFDTRDIYKKAFKILCNCPYLKPACAGRPVREIAVSCFNLMNFSTLQLELFEDVAKKESLVGSIDKINERWGDFVVTPGRMLGTKDSVPDRIAFGGVKELEEFTLSNT